MTDLIKKIDTLFNKEQYKKIISLLPNTLLDKNQSAELYAWRAWAHNRLEENEKAFYYAEKAILVDPKNASGYRQRGGAWFNIGEYDKAILDYNKAIELRPDYELAYINRGSAWNSKGNSEKAINDYNFAIRLNKKSSHAYNNRGIVWANKKEYDKAIFDYNKAIELKKDNVHAYINRGNLWYNRDQYDKSISDYNIAIELKKDYAPPYNNRGGAFFYKKDYHKAIESYSKAIELKSDYASAYRNRGAAYYSLEDFQKAIKDFQKAISLDEKYGFLEYNIRLAIEKLNDRAVLEESKAQPKDKEEKIKIEKEIEKIINTIREAAKSEVKMVVHYTKVFVADIYVKEPRSKMNYSNAIYMNDPMEGKVFFDYLDDASIESAYLNGERRTETSVYLGSFLPAEEDNGNVSHEDELVMWRTYGKDEKGKEAAGCSVVISSSFFKIKSTKEEDSSAMDLSEELLNVVYIKKHKQQQSITNDSKGKVEPAIKALKSSLKKLIRLRNKYNPKEDFFKDIENTIFSRLSTISYLFKSADYDFEHEVRVITYMPRGSDSIRYRENADLNAPKKRFYIESYNDILPYVKKMYLGPKVEHYQQWALYFDHEIRQRAKEFELMANPPYKIKPSEIEIMKSVCKFQ